MRRRFPRKTLLRPIEIGSGITRFIWNYEMSERISPNFDTLEIPLCQVDTERFKPQNGWKPDKVYLEDDYEHSRDHYVDVHDLIDVCNLPQWLPPNTYAVNALGWIVSKKGHAVEGESTWRRLRGNNENVKEYLHVHIKKMSDRRSGNDTEIIVHKLVLAAFGDYDSSRVDYNPVNAVALPHQTHHIDSDKRNNHILNLVQVTPYVNVRHSQIRQHQGHARSNNTTGETGVVVK